MLFGAISQPVTPPWTLFDGDPALISSAAVYPTANAIYACRLWVPVPMTIDRFYVYVSTASGNLDVGIYNGPISAPTRVWSLSGAGQSTICPSAGFQPTTLATPLSLAAGWYLSMFQVDNVTANILFQSVSGNAAASSYQVATTPGSFGLGATLGAMNRAVSRKYGPVWVAKGAPSL